MIDFRYDTFLMLCEVLNYTKTAEILNMTQPAVTQHIHYIEKELGIKLFEKSGKSIYLSQDGKKLYQYIKKLKADSKLIKKNIESLKKDRSITFGATLTIGEYIMPPILMNMISNGYRASMLVENTESLLNKIETGEIPFAFIEGFFDKSKYGYKLFRNEKFVGVSNYETNTEIELKDIFDTMIIVREKGSGTRDIFEKELFERNYSIEAFKNVIEIGNIGAIKSLVKKGVGISFMYECAVDSHIEKLKIKDFQISHEFNIVYNKDSIIEDEILEMVSDMI